MSLKTGTRASNSRILARYIYPGCCALDVICGFPRTPADYKNGYSEKQIADVEKELKEILSGEHTDYYYSDEEMYGGDGFFNVKREPVTQAVLAQSQVKAFEPMLLEAGFVKLFETVNNRLSSKCTMYQRDVKSSVTNVVVPQHLTDSAAPVTPALADFKAA